MNSVLSAGALLWPHALSAVQRLDADGLVHHSGEIICSHGRKGLVQGCLLYTSVVSHLVHQLNARATKKSVVEMKLRNHFFRVHTHRALVKMRVVPANQEDIYIHVFQPVRNQQVVGCLLYTSRCV